MFQTNTSPTSPSAPQKPHQIDAMSSAGSLSAKRSQSAWIRVAADRRLVASSAVIAASLLPRAADPKRDLRLSIAEVKDALAQNVWPAQVTIVDESGREVTVTLTGPGEAEFLLRSLENRLLSS
jgi:hypothetical protein